MDSSRHVELTLEALLPFALRFYELRRREHVQYRSGPASITEELEAKWYKEAWEAALRFYKSGLTITETAVERVSVIPLYLKMEWDLAQEEEDSEGPIPYMIPEELETIVG